MTKNGGAQGGGVWEEEEEEEVNEVLVQRKATWRDKRQDKIY
jgi:hypothetical protein